MGRKAIAVPEHEVSSSAPEVKEQKPKKAAAKKPKKVSAEPDDIPRDLRGDKRHGRMSNAEKTSKKYIDQQKALLAAELLGDLRKNRATLPWPVKVNLLKGLLNNIVLEDDSNDEGTVSLEVMGKRYLSLHVQIQDANEASQAAFTQQQEDYEDETEETA